MSQTRIRNFSISLDGFGTGEPQSREAPFAHAGERLHEWMFATRFWDASEVVGAATGPGTAGADNAFAEPHVLADRHLMTPSLRFSLAESVPPSAWVCESLNDASRDRTVGGNRQVNEVEERPAVLWPLLTFRADATQVRAKAGPAAAGHDEPYALVHMVVERQTVRAANKLDSVAVQYSQEPGLVNAETPVLVRRVIAVKARRHVHQHHPIRFI
jgi:hypothetical protein